MRLTLCPWNEKKEGEVVLAFILFAKANGGIAVSRRSPASGMEISIVAFVEGIV